MAQGKRGMPVCDLDDGRPDAKVLAFEAPKREPCRECGGKGWLAVRYYAPGSATLQSTVRVCDCMKGEGR